MRSFYEVTDKIRELLIADNDINVVSFGDPSEIDWDKQTIYPIAHVVPGSATLRGSTTVLSFDIALVDRVNQTREEDRDQHKPFQGSDNTQDVLNTMLHVGTRLRDEFRRGDTWGLGYDVEVDWSAEPLMDSYTNLLAGWIVSMDVVVPNNLIDLC